MSDAVVVERWLPAEPEEVWRYFTEASMWARWQGIDASIDPRPGGQLVIRMGGESSEAGARGEFVLLDPPYRLVFTWGWVNAPFGEVPPGSTTVEVELRAAAGGTLLLLTHSGLPPSLEGIHGEGWGHYLGRLETVLAGRDPGPDPSET